MHRARALILIGIAATIALSAIVQGGSALAGSTARFGGEPADNFWTLDITSCQDGLTIQGTQTQLSTDQLAFSVQLAQVSRVDSGQSVPLTVTLPYTIAAGSGSTAGTTTATFFFAMPQSPGTNLAIQVQRWDHGEAGATALQDDISGPNPPNDGSGYDDVITTTDQVSTCTLAPQVTSVSPASGPVSGGTQVVIGGTGLTAVSAVTFGGVAASSFTADPSGSMITAICPARSAAGTVDVQVTTTMGASPLGSADMFTYVAPPTTPTSSSVPPPATATNTPVPPPATATGTSVPPTNTATNTPVPPPATATNTSVPLAVTNTPIPPVATATATPPHSVTSTASASLTAPASTRMTISPAGGTLSFRLPQISRTGARLISRVILTVPAGAVAQAVTFSAALAPAKRVLTSSSSVPRSPAVVLSATTATGGAVQTFRRPLTLTLNYDPTGLSLAAQSRLIIAFVDLPLHRWISLPTTLHITTHTLTAQVSHPALVQVRLLTGAALRLVWSLIVSGQPTQNTIVGGRTQACPSVGALLKVISTNTRQGFRNPFAPPYPSGCLWLPFELSDPALAPQFVGAKVLITAAFTGTRSVTQGTTLDESGRAVTVVRIPFRPRLQDRVPGHMGPASLVTLAVVVTDRRGASQPPLYARIVVVPPGLARVTH